MAECIDYKSNQMNTKLVAAGIAAIALIIVGSFAFYSVKIAGEAKQVFEYSNAAQTKQAFTKNPNDPAALRGMASQSILDHDYKSAIRFLQQCVKIDPQDKGSYLRLAHVFLLDGQETKAVPILKSLAKDNDDYGKHARSYLHKIQGPYKIH